MPQDIASNKSFLQKGSERNKNGEEKNKNKQKSIIELKLEEDDDVRSKDEEVLPALMHTLPCLRNLCFFSLATNYDH